jgi:hypothetical protein
MLYRTYCWVVEGSTTQGAKGGDNRGRSRKFRDYSIPSFNKNSGKPSFRVLQIPVFSFPGFTDYSFFLSGFYRFRLFSFRVLQIPSFSITDFKDSGFSRSGFKRFQIFAFRVLKVLGFSIPDFKDSVFLTIPGFFRFRVQRFGGFSIPSSKIRGFFDSKFKDSGVLYSGF